MDLPKTGEGPENTMLQRVNNRKPEVFEELRKELYELSQLVEIRQELITHQNLLNDLKQQLNEDAELVEVD